MASRRPDEPAAGVRDVLVALLILVAVVLALLMWVWQRTERETAPYPAVGQVTAGIARDRWV